MPKLTQITKINKDGGPGYRLTAIQESIFITQDELDENSSFSVCIFSKFGLFRTPYSLVPKAYSPQGHNIIQGKSSKDKSLFDYIERFSTVVPTLFRGNNALKKEIELELKIVRSRFFNGKAYLAIIPGERPSAEICPLTCVKEYVTPALIRSLQLKFEEDRVGFRKNTADLLRKYRQCSVERDLYTLDSYLEYMGISLLQHKKKGIDIPNPIVQFAVSSSDTIEIPMSIELKKFSELIFRDLKSQNSFKKYGSHSPFSVLCLRARPGDWKAETEVGIVSIEDLVSVCSKISGLETPTKPVTAKKTRHSDRQRRLRKSVTARAS